MLYNRFFLISNQIIAGNKLETSANAQPRFTNAYYLLDWSVIYVGIFFAIVVAAVICSVAFIVCKKKKIKLKPRRRYTRLEQNEQSMEMRRKLNQSSILSIFGAGALVQWLWEETYVKRSWVRIPALYTGWKFFHIYCCKNCNVV